jgi:sialidase-1
MKTCKTRTFSLSASLILVLFLSCALQCKNEVSGRDNSGVISELELVQLKIPMFTGKTNESIINLKFTISGNENPVVLTKVTVSFTEDSYLQGISSAVIKYADNGAESVFGTETSLSDKIQIRGTLALGTGSHILKFDFALKPEADLLTRFRLKEIELSFKNHRPVKICPSENYVHRTAMVLRARGQDNCDTYRIPGLVTTSKGTLIAVYDNRYNNSKDLQEDIDIGMSRSTDGGQSWEPMKVIMDMVEYGGRSQRLNGIGDPCVLYDHQTNTIWVAALWMSGANFDQMLWWASKPGMKPEETGQFVLVKSTDDGVTWSQPVNITGQIKDPGWQLLLQGPGRGITMKDGTLVFPAQFKADTGTKALDGGQYTCHSTIVYSKDHGSTWQIGNGAKPNTTEAQVVELADGSLMLNMRDDRNRSDKGDTNGRAVAVTKDLGNTWTVHPSSNSALPEPNCMASLIVTDIIIGGKNQQVLFFANPNSKTERTHMTIKASLDGGLTWPETFQTELYSGTGYGYSCLTMVDQHTIGILYEGTKELFFQKIPVGEILSSVGK